VKSFTIGLQVQTRPALHVTVLQQWFPNILHQRSKQALE